MSADVTRHRESAVLQGVGPGGASPDAASPTLARKPNHARKPLCSWGLLPPIAATPAPTPTSPLRSPETLSAHLLSTTHILSGKRTLTSTVRGRCTASAREHVCAPGEQWKECQTWLVRGGGRGSIWLARGGRADGEERARPSARGFAAIRYRRYLTVFTLELVELYLPSCTCLTVFALELVLAFVFTRLFKVTEFGQDGL
jgi:hypothetical protein